MSRGMRASHKNLRAALSLLSMAGADSAGLGRNSQQLAHVAAQDRFAIGIAQAGRRKNLLDRRHCPRERIIRAHAKLADPTYGDQMPQRLRCENYRVVIELL